MITNITTMIELYLMNPIYNNGYLYEIKKYMFISNIHYCSLC